MIIDGHGHACGEYLNIEGIKEKVKKSGIDCVVLTAGELNHAKTYGMKDAANQNPVKEPLNMQNKFIRIIAKLTGNIRDIPQGNQYVYQLKRQAPNYIKQYYWITKDNVRQLDQDYKQMNFEGVKLHQCWEKFEIDSKWFKEVMAWVMEKDLPLFIHLYNYKEVSQIISFIKEYPKAKIIIAHSYGMEYFMKQDINYFNNIYFDLSNSYFVSDYRIIEAYKRFGSTKLLLGSDTPYGKNALEKTIEHICNFNLTSTEKDNILGDNLKNLLKL